MRQRVYIPIRLWKNTIATSWTVFDKVDVLPRGHTSQVLLVVILSSGCGLVFKEYYSSGLFEIILYGKDCKTVLGYETNPNNPASKSIKDEISLAFKMVVRKHEKIKNRDSNYLPDKTYGQNFDFGVYVHS